MRMVLFLYRRRQFRMKHQEICQDSITAGKSMTSPGNRYITQLHVWDEKCYFLLLHSISSCYKIFLLDLYSNPALCSSLTLRAFPSGWRPIWNLEKSFPIAHLEQKRKLHDSFLGISIPEKQCCIRGWICHLYEYIIYEYNYIKHYHY